MVAQQHGGPQQQHQQPQQPRRLGVAKGGKQPARQPLRQRTRQERGQHERHEPPAFVRHYEYERLPANVPAEEALLGCVMIDPGIMAKLLWMKPEYFFREQYRVMWTAFLALAEAECGIDEITVTAWLEEAGKLEDAGGELEVFALGTRVPAAHNHLDYARLIMNCWWRRESIRNHSEAANLAYGAQDIAEAFSYEEVVYTALRDAVIGLGIMDGQQLGQGNAGMIKSVEALRQMPRPEWLVAPWLGARTIGLLYGPSNVGKSFVALDLALSIASRHAWMGMETMHNGPVVYLAAEGVEGMVPRIDAWLRYYDKRDSDIADFGVIDHVPNLLDTTAVGQTIAAIKDLPETPALLILDTLAAAMPGYDENSPDAMGAVTAALRRMQRECDCAILVVHHSGKDQAKGARGHSSLIAAVDSAFEMTEDLIAGRIALHTKKQRNSSKQGLALALKLQKVSLDEWGDASSVVPTILKGVEPPQPVVKISAEAKHADAILAYMRAHPNARFYAQVQRGYCEAASVGEATFVRGWRALIASGRVRDTNTTAGYEILADEDPDGERQ